MRKSFFTNRIKLTLSAHSIGLIIHQWHSNPLGILIVPVSSPCLEQCLHDSLTTSVWCNLTRQQNGCLMADHSLTLRNYQLVMHAHINHTFMLELQLELEPLGRLSLRDLLISCATECQRMIFINVSSWRLLHPAVCPELGQSPLPPPPPPPPSWLPE